MFYRLLILFILCNVVGCQGDDAAFDVGPGDYQQVICVPFQESFRACYGPGWSEGVARKKDSYDFYSISVEQVTSHGSTVLFTKKFSINEVKTSVRAKDVENLVRLDNLTVRFLIQEPPYAVDISKFISANSGLAADQ